MYTGMVTLGVALLTVVLLAMGVRFNIDDPAPEPASAAEVSRQEAAITISRIYSTASSLGPADELASAIAIDATQWLETLGGVWIPWPQGAPEGYANPDIDLDSPDVSREGLAQQLTELSTSLVAQTGVDTDIATSIALAARIDAAQLADDSTVVCPSVDYASLAHAAADGVSLQRIETARQWFETVAAQAPIGERQGQIDRVDQFTDLTEAIIDAEVADTRPALAPRASASAINDAYALAFEHLIFLSGQADATMRDNIVNFLCQTALYPDATGVPEVASALPGIPQG